MNQPTRADLAPIHQALIPPYIDYCRTVSRRSMAISIETATYLAWVCFTRDPMRTCDLGSGFTSFVLRSFPASVVSVDDDAEWLERTREFLDRNNMGSNGLVGWEQWLTEDDTYDVIVHDFARGDLRNSSMWEAAERLNPAGVLIFDDAQHEGHCAEMHKVADHYGFEPVDIRALTIDMVKRYALAVHA